MHSGGRTQSENRIPTISNYLEPSSHTHTLSLSVSQIAKQPNKQKTPIKSGQDLPQSSLSKKEQESGEVIRTLRWFCFLYLILLARVCAYISPHQHTAPRYRNGRPAQCPRNHKEIFRHHQPVSAPSSTTTTEQTMNNDSGGGGGGGDGDGKVSHVYMHTHVLPCSWTGFCCVCFVASFQSTTAFHNHDGTALSPREKRKAIRNEDADHLWAPTHNHTKSYLAPPKTVFWFCGPYDRGGVLDSSRVEMMRSTTGIGSPCLLFVTGSKYGVPRHKTQRRLGDVPDPFVDIPIFWSLTHPSPSTLRFASSVMLSRHSRYVQSSSLVPFVHLTADRTDRD